MLFWKEQHELKSSEHSPNLEFFLGKMELYSFHISALNGNKELNFGQRITFLYDVPVSEYGYQII